MELTKPEVIAAFGALIAVIGILWGLVLMWIKDSNKRLKKYEDKVDESHKEVVKLTGEVEFVKGKMDGISQLSRSVLDEIANLKLKTIRDKNED